MSRDVAQPRRDVPQQVVATGEKLDQMLGEISGLPPYEKGYHRDENGTGISIGFDGIVANPSEIPTEVDGDKVKIR